MDKILYDYALEKFKDYLNCDAESIAIWFHPHNIRWMNETEIFCWNALIAMADD